METPAPTNKTSRPLRAAVNRSFGMSTSLVSFTHRISHVLFTPSFSTLRPADLSVQPFQVSHLAGHSVAMVLDSLRTLELILRDPSGSLRVPLFRVCSVARQAPEASDVALCHATRLCGGLGRFVCRYRRHATKQV